MKITDNVYKTTYKGITIHTINTDWGWYIETSDGLQTDYFKFKREADQRVRQIKEEIKRGNW
jgi:hypothetical protein